VAPPVVALQNGGGIRNDAVLPAGDVSALDTYDVTPFANFVAVAPELPVEAFVAAVDHGAGAGEGSFAQVAGFSYTADPDAPAGSRVQTLTLADGTPVVAGGQRVLDGTISVASIDFLLRGSDGYDALDGAAFEVLPTTQQQALQGYLRDDLGGTVTAAQYPEAGTGRITQL
jgi:5'-nucleotidase / UDP-sugar diphosphatase